MLGVSLLEGGLTIAFWIGCPFVESGCYAEEGSFRGVEFFVAWGGVVVGFPYDGGE